MTNVVRIEVTAADVEAGRPCSPKECPVARAAGRVLPHAPDSAPAVVSPLWLCHGPWMAREKIRLPADVGDRIAAYDRSGVMLPFSFEVEVEEES